MAWTFYYDREHWNEARLSAMIYAVPAGRMELIDYACKNQEIYKITRALYGACVIQEIPLDDAESWCIFGTSVICSEDLPTAVAGRERRRGSSYETEPARTPALPGPAFSQNGGR